MWDLGNRDIVVLVSVISGWAVLLNIFGLYIGSTITIGLILCGWLIYNGGGEEDTPLTPHVVLALDCLEQAASETHNFLTHIWHQFILSIAVFRRNLRHLYRVNIAERMAQRRRSTYQLSSEIHSSSRNSSRYSLVDSPDPIAGRDFRNFENSPYLHADRVVLERSSSLGLLTSTPILSWKKEDATKNGDVLIANQTHNDANTWKNSQSFGQNHTLSKGEETNYSPKGSPWGMSISPKMRPRAAGIKTVQTVAGPLLASTRYNIDPKVYSDVTSPGLTTRLTKYATEANTKLTHQSQYGTGQFPRVNLNSSPTPLINAKTGKTRMPVTVRIAPPEISRNVKFERQKILSGICQAERKEQQQPSVVQVLREISLKRHASREDVTYEIAKKQRTEGVYSEGLENLEEMTQKRGRDDSSRSEEEVSPHSKLLRPAKRSKMPSCHEILSSLSSSINVSSGVKRKAIDVSRSGTPEVGKHFKSLDSSHGDIDNYNCSPRSISEPTKTGKLVPNDSETQISDLQRPNKRSLESSLPEKVPLKPRLPDAPVSSNAAPPEATGMRQDILKRQVEPKKKTQEAPVKLAEKLFMKARPENIDKIKTLIEEHGSIKPRFTTDSNNEIKKSDIVNMRQTSMRNRLKSMFDAISGKGTSRINPEVVIQAEDKSTSSGSIVVSLSSSTSTTNVNTSPIATSAIVPIIGKSKPTTTPAKHVSFQLTNNDTSPKSSSGLENSKFSPIETKIGGIVPSQEAKKLENSRLEKTSSANTNFVSSNPTTSFSSSSVTTSPSKPVVQISFTQTTTPPTSRSVSVVSTASTPQFNSTSTTCTPTFGIPTTTITKSDSSFQPGDKNQSTVNFSFNVPKTWSVALTGQSAGSVANASSPLTSEAKGNQATTVSALAPIVLAASTTSTSIFSPSDSVTKSSVESEISTSTSLEAPPSLDKGAAKGTSIGLWGGTFAEDKVAVKNQSFPFEVTSAPATKTPTGFTFVKSPTSDILFGAPNASTTSIGYSASSTSTAGPFTTMGSNSTLSATAKPGFSFGVTTPATTTLATTSSIAPSLSFGVTSSNSAMPVFEGASTTSVATAQPSIFRVQTTTSSLPSTRSNLFGTSATTATPTTTASSTMTMQPSIFAFGTSSSGGGQATSLSNTFSGTLRKPEQPGFGGTTVAPSSSSPATLPTFGSSGFGQKPATASFGNNAPIPSFTTGTGNTSSLFEARGNEAFAAPGTTGSAPSYSFPSSVTSTPAFGTPNTAPPSFGASNTSTTSFGAITTAAPTFGSLNTITPTFGTPNSSTVTIANQNLTSPNFSSPSATTFGATNTAAPPAFPTVSTSGFGTSAGNTTFGTSINPPPAFGSAKTFGQSFGALPNATLPFGIQTSVTTSSFGPAVSSSSGFGTNTTNSNNNNNNNNNSNNSDGHNSNTNASFTFGASQPNQSQQPQQQNAVFTFGGAPSTSSNNNTTTTTGPSTFQFNTAAQQSGGFNFTGAPAAPAINFSKDGASGNSFALPTPGVSSFSVPPTAGGMFSIGTGSTAPRSRPSRRRQR